MRIQSILRSFLISAICLGVIAGEARAQSSAPPPSPPIQTSPGPLRTKLSGAEEPPQHSKSPLYVGAGIGAGLGLLLGGGLGYVGHGLGNIDCESSCDNDGTDEVVGVAVLGALVGGLFGLGIGALVYAANGSDEDDELARARDRERAKAPHISPVLSLSSTGAIAGVGGAF